MKKKLLIFDLDGTLINTVNDLNKATNFALEKHHYPLRSIKQTTDDIGNGVAKLIERSVPLGTSKEEYLQILSEFKEYYKEHYFDNSFPYVGVKETLIKLKEMGYYLAVVSNKFNEGANALVNKYFKNIFDHIQGLEEPYKAKPNNDMVIFTMSKLGFNAKETLYIGDTNVDYETAKNANVDIVLVSYGYRSKDYLTKNIKNPHIIDHMWELIDYLR